MPLFLQPKWDAAQSHYVIDTTEAARSEDEDYVSITKGAQGSTTFTDEDALYNITDDMVAGLIEEGGKNKWFSKLPSHEQLMKRVVHTFGKLASDTDTHAALNTVLMTPKQLTFLWMPLTPTVTVPTQDGPALYIDESEESGSEGSGEDDVNIQESDLPAVSLKDNAEDKFEKYLLTRLRAAKAKVEAEQIRMQFFEATGRMPPDSESDSEDE
jgi:hypothetical protein